MMVDYQHQTLPTNRSIRVLRLKPGRSPAAELQCELVPVSLDNSPKFCALSYSWDSEAPSHPIVCQTGNTVGTLKITPNCAAALFRLRHATNEVTMWIDSICIDQSSVEERNQQVPLMTDIYRNAERVVVWLGESDATSETAIGLLRQIGNIEDIVKKAERSALKALPGGTRGLVLAKSHARAKALTAGVTDEEHDKIGPLFRRSWFHRMWTVQEVALPMPPQVEVHCGESTISWLELYMAIDVLRAIDYEWGPLQSIMRLQQYVGQMMVRYRVPGAEATMNSIPGLELELTISLLLIFCRSRLASNPRDKVYALYGLLKALNIELSPPDYNKSVGEIYAEVTAQAIKHDKMLLVLFYTPSDRRRDDIPSWVPDWSDVDWDDGEPRYPVTRGHFAAAQGTEARWRFTSNPLQLVVYGKIVDTIMFRYDSFEHDTVTLMNQLQQGGAEGGFVMTSALLDQHKVHQTMKSWVEVTMGLGTYPTGEPIKEVLRRTLVADWPIANSDKRMKQFGAWLDAMQSSDAELAEKGLSELVANAMLLSSGTLSIRSLVKALLGIRHKPEPMSPEVRRGMEGLVPFEMRALLAMSAKSLIGYQGLAQAFSAKRAFLRTEGGYVGTAPDKFPGSMQSGDQVAILAGMAMPVILRGAGDGYKLVSPVYVHGMMHGEVWGHIHGGLDEILLV